jgi:hypothetical protein
MASERLCLVPGCGKKHYARDRCQRHYLSEWRASEWDRATTHAEFLTSLLGHTGDECVIWPFFRGTSGYGQVFYKGRMRIASNLLCEMAHGPAPVDRWHAAHSCGNGRIGCVNPRHLSWKTPKENAKDQTVGGVKHPHGKRKLTDAIVTAIRSDPRPRKVIARDYGISYETVRAVCSGDSWKHVPMP